MHEPSNVSTECHPSFLGEASRLNILEIATGTPKLLLRQSIYREWCTDGQINDEIPKAPAPTDVNLEARARSPDLILTE